MRVGDVIAGRYRVVRQAGSGAMSHVFEAYDMVGAESVALKTLRGDLDADEKGRARLKYEAKALREIDHPAVVRYVDHGLALHDEPFLVMQWVPGTTLAARLRAGVAPREALALVERVASGLEAAHALRIVHRDLKPSNVMLRHGDVAQAVVVDFGVARVRRTTGGVRLTGDLLGTPRYMAPEQIRGARDVDGKADVFALGCILFECLTGRRAFSGPDAVTVLARILFEPPPRPSAVDAALAPFDALVGETMDHDVGRRPSAASVAERARALGASLFHAPRIVAAFAEAASPMSAGTLPLHSAPLRTASPELGPEAAGARLMALLAGDAPLVSVTCSDPAHAVAAVTEALRGAEARGDAPWDALIVATLTRARSAADAARVVAAQAGVPLDGVLPPESAVGAALARLGRVLLVLHGVDAGAEALGSLAQAWTAAAPRLRVLTTSTGRWPLRGAVVVAIARV
jgi:hypothetical protein